MISKLFSASALWYQQGLVAIRILVGAMMAYHGLEIFDRPLMEGYLTWDVFKVLPAPEVMVYFGKSVELVAGVCLMIGMLTRVAALTIAADMLFVTFYVGNGKFYYQDQHPFLFAVVAMVFFFTGPVKWCIDAVLFKAKTPEG